VLKNLKGLTITIDKLRRLILTRIGGTERTVSGYMAFMQEVGMIKDVGNCRWEIK